ncbi:PEP-CTERM sorting domain-containing protein [Roseateles sp. BYS180W]|uniref:PEP-CTERM sorting domain-containing protein n=1 Tax=Roseateles rivi TaxID=3299028 RepID=A0ABW7FSL9_9BURK
MAASFILRATAAATLLLLGVSAQSAITVYNTAAAFAGATASSGTDTFTGMSVTGTTPSPLNRMAGSYAYMATSTSGAFYAGGTTSDPFLSTNRFDDIITITPTSSGISGIAGNFFGSDVLGSYAGGPVTLTVTDSFGMSLTQVVNASSITSGSYMGFVSDGTITSLSIASASNQTAPFVWPSVDNLTLATAAPVPEPGTWALMALGLVGMSLTRRRRAD